VRRRQVDCHSGGLAAITLDYVLYTIKHLRFFSFTLFLMTPCAVDKWTLFRWVSCNRARLRALCYQTFYSFSHFLTIVIQVGWVHHTQRCQSRRALYYQTKHSLFIYCL
jgi:hypothetical protein